MVLDRIFRSGETVVRSLLTYYCKGNNNPWYREIEIFSDPDPLKCTGNCVLTHRPGLTRISNCVIEFDKHLQYWITPPLTFPGP
jgi:hypothetical protein